MSEEETVLQTEDGQMLTAEYRDGHLQIVEVSPFERISAETHILPDTISEENQTKYIQVLDSTGKGLMQLDLLNFTLVKCGDEPGDESYQMVGSSSDDGGETTLTCVLANDENDEQNQESSSYVLLESVEENNAKREIEEKTSNVKKQLTPTEILEKAKALQKAKAAKLGAGPGARRGRKRRSALPGPLELLSSPNFRLYLYNCKLCPFKCNAIKEMSAHKATEHGSGSGAKRGEGPRSRTAALQCAHCPFRAAVHTQLIKHGQDVHNTPSTKETKYILVDLNKKETPDSDGSDVVEVIACGACGFESTSRETFTAHVRDDHGITLQDNGGVLSVVEGNQSQ